MARRRVFTTFPATLTAPELPGVFREHQAEMIDLAPEDEGLGTLATCEGLIISDATYPSVDAAATAMWAQSEKRGPATAARVIPPPSTPGAFAGWCIAGIAAD
jgi:hypothetical protein